MSQPLGVRFCRIIAPEKLPDRFLISQVLSPEDNILSNGVLLTYIFEVSKPWLPSAQLLPELERVLHEQYQKLIPGNTIGDQFELLLRGVNIALNSVSEAGETDWIGNLNGIIMVLSENELHFSQTGRSPAYLLQRNKIRQITDDPSEERELHPLKTFSNISSGVLHANDAILLSNTELYREISLDALRRVVTHTSPLLSCQTIVKELKRSKNAAISSIVLGLVAREELQNTPEPATEILLEQELENRWKKIMRTLKPFIVQGKEVAKRAGTQGAVLAKKTQETVVTKVAPKTEQLVRAGLERAKAAQSAHKRSRSKVVVERIYAPGAEEVHFENTPPITEQLQAIPLAKISPLEAVGSTMRIYMSKSKVFLSTKQGKKIAALILAIILLALSLAHVAKKHAPVTVNVNNSKVDSVIATTQDLIIKTKTAITLNQNIEAAHHVEDAQNNLLAIQDASGAQTLNINQLWDQVTTQSDQLTKTTRLITPAASYKLSSEPEIFISQRPFFYATGSGSLLRARSGDTEKLTKDVPLPDSSDTLIALARSRKADTAGFALSKTNQVYRVSQTGETTLITKLSIDGGGSFATADNLASYASNLYLLDSKSGLLWRYNATATGFSKGMSLIDSSKHDIKGTVSLGVDGSVYLLEADGSMQKYISGKQDPIFTLKDQPYLVRTLVHPLQLITDETMNSIFVLDAGITSADHSTARVVEFNKNGSYVQSYGFPSEDTQVHAFDISLQDRKLWILNGQTIQEFNL
jgi:hypothetical protein